MVVILSIAVVLGLMLALICPLLVRTLMRGIRPMTDPVLAAWRIESGMCILVQLVAVVLWGISVHHNTVVRYVLVFGGDAFTLGMLPRLAALKRGLVKRNKGGLHFNRRDEPRG